MAVVDVAAVAQVSLAAAVASRRVVSNVDAAGVRRVARATKPPEAAWPSARIFFAKERRVSS